MRAKVIERHVEAARAGMATPNCVVCLDAKPDRVLQPCGHVLCAVCVDVLRSGPIVGRVCPTCRSTFAAVNRVFIA